MKIAFLCPSLSRMGGGIFSASLGLAHAIAHFPDTSVEVFGPSDRASNEDKEAWDPLPLHLFAFSGPSSFRYSPLLQQAFLATSADVGHVHGLWMFNSLIILRWMSRWRKPFIVTLHGMLDPWALRHSAGRKIIAWWLYQKRCLTSASCLHVQTEAELRCVRNIGLDNPVCLIPNAVVLPPTEKEGNLVHLLPAEWSRLLARGTKILFYLGRLHAKKGLPNLLRAWSQTHELATAKHWVLVIAGWDENRERLHLEKLVKHLRLTSSVVLLAPQFGTAKDACLQTSTAVVLPSLSEGVPMVVLEAWAHAKPVLMTEACNLPSGLVHGAALGLGTDAGDFVEGLSHLLHMSDNDRQLMGRRGRALVEKEFHWPGRAEQMRATYLWLNQDGPLPDCVVTH